MRIALLVLLLASSSPGVEEMFLRVDPPENASWVGQQVLIPVTVGLRQRPSGSPQFRVPEVSGGVLAFVPGPIYGNEERDGVDFTTWTYSFAFYPHRQGEHTVPSISAEARVPRGDGTWQRVAASTKPFTVRSQLPAIAGGLSTIVTTTKLTVEESWEPDQTGIRVGDAITRTISMHAAGVMGMGLPPLRFGAPDGIAVYPKAPTLEDEAYRGEINGQRIETVVYLCEREGEFRLPALTILWFDPSTEELNRVELPERVLSVAANPAFAVEPDVAETAAGGRWRLALGAFCGVLATAGVILAAYRHVASLASRFGRCVKKFARHMREPLPPLNPFLNEDGAL